jgi:hypothetical protein
MLPRGQPCRRTGHFLIPPRIFCRSFLLFIVFSQVFPAQDLLSRLVALSSRLGGIGQADRQDQLGVVLSGIPGVGGRLQEQETPVRLPGS